MKKVDIKILEANGWTVECESPLEIRHEETESFASGTAAYFVLDAIVSAEEREKRLIEELAQKFVDGFNADEKRPKSTINTVFDFGCMGKMTHNELVTKFYYCFKDKGIV
jgi:hypothetical protein